MRKTSGLQNSIEEQARFRDHRIAKPLPAYSTATLLARRRLFDRVGQFDPALPHGDSTEWFLRAAECGAVSELLPDVLLYRRLHKENRTRPGHPIAGNSICTS